jgi:hypothetical protein
MTKFFREAIQPQLYGFPILKIKVISNLLDARMILDHPFAFGLMLSVNDSVVTPFKIFNTNHTVGIPHSFHHQKNF